VPETTPSEIYQMAVDNSTEASDRSKGDLYVADFTGGIVYRFEEAGKLNGEIEGLAEPTSIAVDTKGDLYVGEFSEGKLLEYWPEGAVMDGGNPVLEVGGNPNGRVHTGKQRLQLHANPRTLYGRSKWKRKR
jgi:hypothetical protein